MALIVAAGVLSAAVAFAAIRDLAASGPRTASAASQPNAPAAFLATYERPDGQVVRYDQGGDTVSEGQAYAMLVAASTGDRARFAAAWGWAASHLLEPSGLMAWRWVGGSVADSQPATDADLGAAAALVRASRRWSDPAYLASGRQLAAAVAAHEVAAGGGVVAGGAATPVLVAGPWALGPLAVLDPSYLAAPELDTLASAFGGPWPALATTASHDLQSLTAGGTLPPDWATPGSDGAVHPASPPGDPGGPVRYGYDAARTPIWLAASCSPADRADAASLLPALRRGGGQVLLDLGGQPAPGASHPVGTLALAAATAASGDPTTAAALVSQAAAANGTNPTYYGSAWLALSAVALDHRLEACP